MTAVGSLGLAQTLTLGGLTMISFHPSWLGVWGEPIGDGASFVPSTDAEALAASRARAVLDGPMFDLCGPAPGADYAHATCARPAFLLYDARRGVRTLGSNPRLGATLAVNGEGAVFMARGAPGVPSGAVAAVQGYPTLVIAGRIEADNSVGSNGEYKPRAALCYLQNGRVAFAVMRGPMELFAQTLRDAGALHALYTDGGGSQDVAVAAGALGPGSAAARTGEAEHRRVPAWLLAAPPPPDAPGWVLPVVGAGLIVAGALALRRGAMVR